MGGLFGGGGNDDGGAAAIAAENARQRDADRAAEQARYDQEQKRIAQGKADETKRLADEQATQQAALDKSRKDAAQQAAAQAKTGAGYAFDNTKTDAGKALAAAQAAKSAGLPGFSNLNKTPAVAAPGGYLGQQNTLLSQTGFNTAAPGGRKYV